MAAPEAVEVDPREAMKEGAEGAAPDTSGIDQIEDTEPQAEDGPAVDVVDVIVPKSAPKTWNIGQGEQQREYVQRELSYFGKMQFFSLVGEVIDKAMSGEGGLKLSSLLNGPGFDGGSLQVSAFADAETFMQAIGKLLTYAPDFLEKSYCIWLAIPEFERPWAIQEMNKPADEGGLTDKQGVEIVEIFIDQNWEAIESFFRNEISSLRDRVQARRREAEESRQSKR